MNNSMAKAMTERYVEYLNTGKLEERAAKSIYYWVMNTIEAIFWGLGRVASLDITLYANEEKIVLVYIHPTGKKYEYVYYSTHECGDSQLPIMLQNFVKIFNDIKYPLSDKISSPVFNAYYYNNRQKEGKYTGYYYIYIHIDMMPDKDERF